MRSLLALTVLLKCITSEVVKSGSILLIPCAMTNKSFMWIWYPKYPKCAGVGSLAVTYSFDAQGQYKAEENRFRNRLTVIHDLEKGIHCLILKDTVMSDSGWFSCGASQAVEVDVYPACHNHTRITVSKAPKLGGEMTLFCISCQDGQILGKGFNWTFNGQPVKTASGVDKTKSVLLLKKIDDKHVGKWGCMSADDPSQNAEYCLQLILGNEEQEYTTQQAIQVTKDRAENGADHHQRHRIEYLWMTTLVGAASVLLVAVVGVIFLIRLQRNKKRLRLKKIQNDPGPLENTMESSAPLNLPSECQVQIDKEVEYASLRFQKKKRPPYLHQESTDSTIYAAVRMK
ncbi:uncharacterized protein LOC120538993 [Polypterus senegalus]|uniref:uncharacterized protein LOC120538993 n=1 Tax=Polypterus senegalus TaxID=55291 RepID=UPI001962CEEB|nr:uncharacterized protein LOC120538993 [Polypterus senegalus]